MCIESAYNPPTICANCKDIKRCELVTWQYAEDHGTTCPVHEPEAPVVADR